MRMSDVSPRIEGGAATGADPLASRSAGLPDDGARRALAFAPFFPAGHPRWSDAMIARTRRHAGGCASSVEMALRIALCERLPALGSILEATGPAIVWRMLEQNPQRMSDALFSHFRLRAGLSLLAAPDGGEGFAAIAAAHPGETTLENRLAGLALSQQRWADRGGEDAPLRADLPAEEIRELASLTAAMLLRAAARSDVEPLDRLADAMNDALQSLLAAHDEESGPLAQAMLVACQIGDSLDAGTWRLLTSGGAILLCALIARRCRLSVDAVGFALVDGREGELLAMCRLADMPADAVLALLGSVGIVRPAPSDNRLQALAAEYEMLSADEARARCALLGLDADLRAAIGRLP